MAESKRKTFTVELVTPEALLFASEGALEADVPGSEGDMGVLENHAPTIAALRPGVVTIEAKPESKSYFIRGGFVEVTQERCTILAKDAEDVASLSASDLKDKAQALKDKLDGSHTGAVENRVQAELDVIESLIAKAA